MNENEQIQEMARGIELLYYCKGYEDDRGCYFANTCTSCKNANKEKSEKIAKHIYAKGYRKVERGEWVKTSEYMPIYGCSICNERNLFRNGNNVFSNFCPNCGADMRKEQNNDENGRDKSSR